jgi:cyclopropane fatty-acyl-phospholipid synthase-like methyltransferase
MRVFKNQIDWNEVWKEQMTKHNEMSGGMDCASYWDDEEEARNYWNMGKEESDVIEYIVRSMQISSTSRVLDIGAGPGNLAIPFSRKAAHVTAVEPSASMACVLRENIKEYGIRARSW